MILMKNLILILIFAAVGLNTMASNPVHVIITAGQSNTDGRTPNEDLPAYIKALATDTLTYAEGAYRYCQIAQNDGKGEFIPFWPRAKRSGKNNMWAFDAVTYYWLEQLLQEKFYVVKWAFLQNLFAISICAGIGMLIGIVIGTLIDYEKNNHQEK